MRITLPRVLLASAVLAAAAAATVPAMAESRVNVPFSFTVNGKTMPAGMYHVQAGPNATTVTLSSPSSAGFLWILSPGAPNPYDPRVILTFDEHDGQHELAAVQAEGRITRRLDHLPKNREYVPTQLMEGE